MARRAKLPQPPPTPTSYKDDVRHHQRETTTNQASSPLLRLPGELRNRIYELVIPNNQVFNTSSPDDIKIKVRSEDPPDESDGKGGDEKEEGIIQCRTIHKKEAYGREFSLSQVCRQLRHETLKLYYSNTFILRVPTSSNGSTGITGKSTTRAVTLMAEKWVASRPPDALRSCTRIILQHWSDKYPDITGMQMALFDLNLRSFTVVSLAEIVTCGAFGESWAKGEHAYHRVCPACFEQFRRKKDFSDVLKAVAEDTFQSEPGQKVLQLIQGFRNKFK